MMFEATKLYAFWGNRRDGFANCAARMAAMLDGLEPIHPAFKGWQYQPPNGRRWLPYGGRPRSFGGLVEVLKADWDKTEIDRTALPGFGLSTSAWNGENSPLSASFRCSLEHVDSSKVPANLATFPLQSRRVGDPSLISAAVLSRTLTAVATAWDAVWGTVHPADLWEAVEMPTGPLRMGWITYLSAPLADRFVAPPDCIARPGPDGSLLILATKEVFDPENPEHLARAQAIQAALDRIQPANLDRN